MTMMKVTVVLLTTMMLMMMLMMMVMMRLMMMMMMMMMMMNDIGLYHNCELWFQIRFVAYWKCPASIELIVLEAKIFPRSSEKEP